MEQHAVPQNIASYEFKLVGDMTLKQFLELAAGVIVGLIFWSLPLPTLVRGFLVFLSVLFGILMAFVPINGRPFGQWVLAFFHAIYSPTQYHWKQPVIKIAAPIPKPQTSLPIQPKNELDQKESQLASRITTLFNPPLAAEVTRQATLPPLPAVVPSKVEVTKEGPPPITDQLPISQPLTPNVPRSAGEVGLFSSLTPIVRRSLGGGGMVASTPATTTPSMPTPTQPNILVGAVTNSSGNPIDGVIIEIADSSTGIPVRALRTNRVGLFQIATPLLAGNYTVLAEKDGLSFLPVSITAADKIIPPILIKSNS